ncbi:MAG: outer membrane lipoprotein-sorting protein [Phycisphaerae bacterium]
MTAATNTQRNVFSLVLASVALLMLPAIALQAQTATTRPADANDANAVPTTMPSGQKDLSVDEIVYWTNYRSYYQGKSGRADVKMSIVDGSGQKRTRQMTILRWDQPGPTGKDGKKAEDDKDANAPEDYFTGEQKYYVYFHRPADVAKTTFLVWKHLGKDDDRWIFFPDLDLVKRISAADKRTSFVGSHFLYEDVSGRNVELDKHELIETNKTYFVLRNTPKDPRNVEFKYYVMYIHRGSFLVVQTTYYDKQGKPYRKYTAKGVKKIQGYPTVVRSRMEDLKTGGYTETEYTEVKYNSGIPEDIFDKRYLRRPPRKHLD